MSTINNIQIENKKKEITDNLIKNSIIPTKTTVSDMLKDHFERNSLGVPSFKPMVIEKDSISNPRKWNENFLGLKNDLDDLFECLVRQNNMILANNETYLYENDKLHNNIIKLNLAIANLEDTLNAKGNLYTNLQTFEDFYSTDFIGNLDRNIPKTDAFVDLVQKKVVNDKKTSSKDKININNALIKMENDPNILSETVVGDIKSMLNDYSNDVCYANYLTANNVKDISFTLNLTLHTIKEMSTVLFECVSVTNFDATLYVSIDNINFKEVYTVNSNNLFEWNFERQEIGYIKIVVDKKSNDGFLDNRNTFSFIFKNISLINDYFYLKSTYVSEPLEFNEILDNICIKSNETIFSNTAINYFVGLDNGENTVEWIHVKNNEKCPLGLLNTHEKIANNSLKEYGSEYKDGCVSILNLKEGYNLNSINVFYGYQMWGVKTLEIPESEDINTYNPSIEDYTDFYVERRSLIDTEEYEFEIRNGFSHLMTQYVYCDDVSYVYKKYIKPSKDIPEKFNCKVYLNNALIKGIDGEYNFTLKKGKNVIHILMYVNCKERSKFTPIKHNFNFKEHTFNVFADKPMKYINDKSLMENIIENNNTYYSVSDNKVIVKEDMRMINEHIKLPKFSEDINYKNNSRYLVIYKSISNEKKNSILYDKKVTRVRVLANLISNSESVSPKINNFRIVGE